MNNENIQHELTQKFEQVKRLWPQLNNAPAVLLSSILSPDVSLLPFLKNYLESPADDVRGTAIFLLCRADEPDLELLSTFIRDKNSRIRNFVSNRLSEIGKPAIDILTRFVEDPDIDIRSFVAGTLGRIGEPALDVLVRLVEDPEPEIRISTAIALQRMKEPQIDILARFVKDPDPEVRIRVVQLLGRLNDDGINASISYLEDINGSVTHHVLANIKRVRSDSAPQIIAERIFEEFIIRKFGRPQEFFNPDIIAEALNEIIQGSPPLQNFVYSRLCEFAYQSDEDIRMRAISVARELSPSKFALRVKAKAEEDPKAAATIMRLLGGGEAAAFLAESQEKDIERYRKPLTDLEEISLKRWNELTNQARWGFWLSLGMSVGWFVVGVAIIVYGLWLLTNSQGIPQQIGGGGLAALVTLITTFSGRFWKDPVVHIQKFSAQQARLQASFIGYMNRVAQLRLVFENQYEQGITIEDIQQYQEMLKDAIDQASQDLGAQEKTSAEFPTTKV